MRLQEIRVLWLPRRAEPLSESGCWLDLPEAAPSLPPGPLIPGLNWVDVKEFMLSYHTSNAILFAIYIYICILW